MQSRKLFRYLQPYFYAGLLDDPVLVINVRPTGRSIMIDCGQLHHLAKRVIRSLDAIFVSHAHMDHFMGFDQILRNVHVAPRDLAVYGPPGIAKRVEHKLAGYDWNLTENTWCNFQVYEIHPQRLEHYEFAGKRGFSGQHRKTLLRHGSTVYQSPYLRVDAALCDHKIPVLLFRITERESFLLDRQRMQQAELLPGPWLRELKRRFHAADWGKQPIDVLRQQADGATMTETFDDAGKLYRAICRHELPASIGYISDLGETELNLDVMDRLLQNITLLFSECTFLAVDAAKARASYHLCTTDLNRIAARLRPRYLVPMHLSKAYIAETGRLYQELDPSTGTIILQLPDYMTPRPSLPGELAEPLAYRPFDRAGTDHQ